MSEDSNKVKRRKFAIIVPISVLEQLGSARVILLSVEVHLRKLRFHTLLRGRS